MMKAPWEVKKGSAPTGGGRGSRRGLSRRAVQIALTMVVSCARLEGKASLTMVLCWGPGTIWL